MRHPERDYLGHIAQAIERARTYVNRYPDLHAFEENPLVQDAVVRNIWRLSVRRGWWAQEGVPFYRDWRVFFAGGVRKMRIGTCTSHDNGRDGDPLDWRR